ncbi:hypothetical protein [Shewanella indica]|jgi:hypothetical protein|uniref:hypothetical protein n=1 Tax=Shewanella indica TaxID=768528 RepID=UPI003003A805
MTIIEELQQELEYLITTDLTTESPRVQAWMEKAANHHKKDELLEGQRFVFDEYTHRLKKIFIS